MAIWTALLSGAIGAGGSVAAGNAQEDGVNAANRAVRKGGKLSREQLAPYSDVGRQGLYGLAELLGIQGYRTQEEQAYTNYLRTKPVYSGPGKIGQSDMEKILGFGPAGAMLSTQTGMMLDGDKVAGQSVNSSLSPANVPGPAKTLYDSKSDRATAQHYAEKRAKEKYATALQAWEAARSPLELASKNSIANYNPMNTLMKTPGYQNRYNTGLNAVMNSQQAKGMDQSGRAMKELTQWGQDYGSNEYQNEIARRSSLAQMGLGASGSMANLAANMANTQSNLAMQQGQNTANMYGNLNNVLQGSLSDYAYLRNQPKPPAAPAASAGIQNGYIGPVG